MIPPHTYGTSREAELHPDVAVIHLSQGTHKWELKRDRVTNINKGRASLVSDSGESIDLQAGTLVHLKEGWKGNVEVTEALEAVIMTCDGGPADTTPVLRDVSTVPAEKDWGPIPTMIKGQSHTSGILLSREPNGRAESGIWICTPGFWNCHVTSDELCHFLLGTCTYTADSGEVFEVKPDTVAFFPKDWRGTCEVHSTVRKVYGIR